MEKQKNEMLGSDIHDDFIEIALKIHCASDDNVRRKCTANIFRPLGSWGLYDRMKVSLVGEIEAIARKEQKLVPKSHR